MMKKNLKKSSTIILLKHTKKNLKEIKKKKQQIKRKENI